MKKNIIILSLSLVLIFILGACASGDLAAQSVENYYQALVDKDMDRAVSLSCADWEMNAQMEVDSFQAVDATLDSFTCEQTGTDGDMAVVNCTGQIVMSYDGEDQFLNLSGQTYQVLDQGGDWLFCGYR